MVVTDRFHCIYAAMKIGHLYAMLAASSVDARARFNNKLNEIVKKSTSLPRHIIFGLPEH